jgi:DNA-binding response OmpR family regulator
MTALDTLPLRDQVEHLKFMIAEMTGSAEECVPFPGVHTTTQRVRLLNLLYRRKGHTVPHLALYAALTWDRLDAEPRHDIVRVQLCLAKRDLAAAGIPWPIECVWGVGYRWVA